jgi:arylsulfatase A
MKALLPCLLVLAPCFGLATEPPPNIVYILADDLGYGDISAYNPESKIQTPHLDTLAANGMMFTDAHTPSSVCTPTRYGLLTGQYSWRSNLKQGVIWSYGRVFLEQGRETVGALLQQHGYRTAVIGKWHLGLDWALKPGQEHSLENAEKREVNGVIMDMDPSHIDFSKPVTRGPQDFGFDYSYILPASLDIPPYCYLENHELEARPTARTEGNDLDKGFMEAFWREGSMAPGFDFHDVLPNFTRKAVRYLEAQAGQEKPFFLYLPLAAPHTPWVPTAEHEGYSGAGMYGDFVQMVDAEVGKILQALADHGLAENTLVVFTSDNGPYWVPRDTERYGHKATAHFRGMKGDIWEGGHRVPYIARWPGKIPSGTTSDALTSLTHLLATTADLLGLADPNRYGEDSYSLLPVLRGETDHVPDQPGIVMHSSKAHFAWREGNWKYIEKRGSGGFSAPVAFDVRMGEHSVQLYNLKDDPAETQNLQFRHPERAREMQLRLDQVRGDDAGID